jgi:hypothetical protein
MADKYQLAILKKGVTAWNQWLDGDVERGLHGGRLHKSQLRGAALRGAHFMNADLEESDLSGADLRGADFANAHLANANCRGANFLWSHLLHADLSQADLGGANLFKADLREAKFCGANLHKADLREADLGRADLSQANLSGADLSRAVLVGANLNGANLVCARVYGVSAWDLSLEGTLQTNLVITPRGEKDITVDNLEVAQFIYLLLNRRKLRDVITTLGEKAVLILGRFTERKALLEAIAAKLRELEYLPIVFDFDRPTDRDLTETVKVLAGLSRFVIADITNPRSVPMELEATVPDYMVPFVTILQRGQPTFSMFDDLPRRFNWALPILEYKSTKTLLVGFEKLVVAPALTKLAEVREQKARVIPRRSAED